jgi:hypothetical protein
MSSRSGSARGVPVTVMRCCRPLGRVVARRRRARLLVGPPLLVRAWWRFVRADVRGLRAPARVGRAGVADVRADDGRLLLRGLVVLGMDGEPTATPDRQGLSGSGEFLEAVIDPGAAHAGGGHEFADGQATVGGLVESCPQ